MKVPFQKLIALLALGGICFAQTATAQTSSTAKTKKRATTAAPKRPAPATVEDIQRLQGLIEQQQQQIQQMQQQMSQRDQQLQQTQQQLQDAQAAAKSAQDKVTLVEATANESKQGVADVKNDVNDIRGNMTSQVLEAQEGQKKVSALSDEIKRFRFTGDVRVRYENFNQDNTLARNRERIRLRFGVEGKLGEDFTGGIFVASGVLTDPTSTNETLTNAFEKKTIGFDRGYIVYNPHYFKNLTVTGGKFAYTWQRTPVTFDSDLNPEGFTEKLSFDVNNKVVKNFNIQGIQLLYNEVSAGPDSYAVGGQVGTKFQLGSFWTMTPSYTVLNWHNNNALVRNAIAGSAANGDFAPNGMTNCTIGTGATRSFCSQFLYSDLIVANTFKTPIAKLPFNLLAEYLENLNTKINQSHAYYVDASLGQTKNKNDVQFGYAFIRQEQDSVIASFNESDQRAPTNIIQHRFMFNWKVAKNTTLGYTQWIGRTLDPNLVNARVSCAPGTFGVTCFKDPFLKRGQLDLVYSF